MWILLCKPLQLQSFLTVFALRFARFLKPLWNGKLGKFGPQLLELPLWLQFRCCSVGPSLGGLVACIVEKVARQCGFAPFLHLILYAFVLRRTLVERSRNFGCLFDVLDFGRPFLSPGHLTPPNPSLFFSCFFLMHYPNQTWFQPQIKVLLVVYPDETLTKTTPVNMSAKQATPFKTVAKNTDINPPDKNQT